MRSAALPARHPRGLASSGRARIVAAMAVLTATLGLVTPEPAVADHCPEGQEHSDAGLVTDEATGEAVAVPESCLGSISGLFPDEGSEPPGDQPADPDEVPEAPGDLPAPDPDETFDPEGGLSATTTTTTTPPGEVEEPDAGIDVGAAILDALDDRTLEAILSSPSFREATGCTAFLFDCQAGGDAHRTGTSFELGRRIEAMAAAGGADPQHAEAVGDTLDGFAIFGALRGEQGEVLFPTLVAAMPVMARLALRALEGDAGDLATLTTFGDILISLDARAQGFLS